MVENGNSNREFSQIAESNDPYDQSGTIPH